MRFGEMAIVDASACGHRRELCEDSTLAVLDGPRFLSLVTETPTFACK